MKLYLIFHFSSPVFGYHYKKIISEDELTNHLQSEHRLDIIHNNINRVCHKYHFNVLQEDCKKIASGESIIHQGREFDCVVKYLEHWKEHVDHRMLPIHDINRIIERELERQIAHMTNTIIAEIYE